jgi:PPM family protein phosphatase
MINIENAHLNIAAASHPGMTGKKNEDRYGVSAFLIRPGDAPFGKDRLPAVLAVVCDGIGGHRAGEVAAQMGVTIITEMVTASCEAPIEDDEVQPQKILEEAIQHANHAIYQASLSDQGRKGMGATCACAWAIDDRLYTANLGDSRIYLLREGHILQLTTDHTWIQEAFDAGIIDETQGEAHPNAHVIRRYLGSPQPPKVDFRLWFYDGEGDAEALDNQGLRLLPGDVVLICSDGLTDLVSDEEIHELIQSTPLAEAPAALIALANARGGHDNSTVC